VSIGEGNQVCTHFLKAKILLCLEMMGIKHNLMITKNLKKKTKRLNNPK
jgi:hypothetical protein